MSLNEYEKLNETIEKIINLKKNKKIAPSENYKNAEMKKFFPKFFGSIWEDLLVNGLKTKEDKNYKIADSRLLETIQNAVFWSSQNGAEAVFKLNVNGKIRFFNGIFNQYFENFMGKPTLAYIQVRKDDPFNTLGVPLIFCFDYDKKKWSVNGTKDNEEVSSNFKKMKDQLKKIDDIDQKLLGIQGNTSGKFEGNPVLAFKNNARSTSDTDGLIEFMEIVDYLTNQIPETHDYERIKYEINLMFNPELTAKGEDDKLRNSRTSTKMNQDERYTTATGILQGQTTIEIVNRVMERWYDILFKLSKTPSLTSGLDGNNQKGSAEVIGADPLATNYALKKKEFFNHQLKRWVNENDDLVKLIGSDIELIISPLLDLKLKFIAEGVVTSEERKNDTKMTVTQNGGK